MWYNMDMAPADPPGKDARTPAACVAHCWGLCVAGGWGNAPDWRARDAAARHLMADPAQRCSRITARPAHPIQHHSTACGPRPVPGRPPHPSPGGLSPRRLGAPGPPVPPPALQRGPGGRSGLALAGQAVARPTIWAAAPPAPAVGAACAAAHPSGGGAGHRRPKAGHKCSAGPAGQRWVAHRRPGARPSRASAGAAPALRSAGGSPVI